MNRPLVLALLLGMVPCAASAQLLCGIAPGEPLAPGAVRTVVLPDEVRRESGASELELVLSLDGGATFPLRVSSEVPAETERLPFRVPNLSTPAARLAVRTGRDGEDERVRAVSEVFSILPSPRAPLEELRTFRGEPATRDAAEAAIWPFFPDGLTGERPERLAGRSNDGGVEDDDASAALRVDLVSGEPAPSEPLAGPAPPRSSRSRAPLQTPKRE